MVKKVSSPNKLRTADNMKKASSRMSGLDIKTKNKLYKTPVKPKKGTTLDNCNLDELILN